MSNGLYSGVSGLAIGVGLYKGVSGLWSGASGLIDGFGGSFSPTSLFSAGEQGGWYDPSDLSTMFQDTAGTVPVTAAGQTVARINDKSGRGNHLTQATAADRPLYAIDEIGLPYLTFITNKWFISPTITPGIDKAQVFAGVRKLNTANGMIAELGNTSTSNGSIAVYGSTSRYSTNSRGTTEVVLDGTSSFTSPVTNVVSTLSDISSPSLVLRVNGNQNASSTSSQGTGNFLAYPLYVGRRGGTSLPFNGRLYQLIVRFGANLGASTIAATEAYVNSKTGAYV